MAPPDFLPDFFASGEKEPRSWWHIFLTLTGLIFVFYL